MGFIDRTLEAQRWTSPAARAGTRLWSGVVIAAVAAPFVWGLFTAPNQGGGSEGTLGWALGQVFALAVLTTACVFAVSGAVRLRRTRATPTDQ